MPAARAGISTSSSIAAPAPISAARKPALIESLEGKKGHASDLKPPFPAANTGRLGVSYNGKQRRDHRRRPDHPAPRRESGSPGWGGRKQYGNQGVLHIRTCQRRRATSRRKWAFHCASSSTEARGRGSRWLAQFARRHPWRLVGSGHPEDRSATACDHGFRRACREVKSGIGTAAVIVMDQSRPTSLKPLPVFPSSTCTNPAASARRAARAPAGCGG